MKPWIYSDEFIESLKLIWEQKELAKYSPCEEPYNIFSGSHAFKQKEFYNNKEKTHGYSVAVCDKCNEYKPGTQTFFATLSIPFKWEPENE